MSKNCGCSVKCEKHKKALKDKCHKYYENQEKFSWVTIVLLLSGLAVLIYAVAKQEAFILLGVLIYWCLVLIVVMKVARRMDAWRNKLHPQNLAEIKRFERSLRFNDMLRKKIKPGEGEECQSRIRVSFDALRSRKLVELEEERKTSTSIYSDKMAELNAHLDVLDSILAGMRGPEKLCFSAAATVNKNYILGEIRHLSYPYLEDMPDA